MPPRPVAAGSSAHRERRSSHARRLVHNCFLFGALLVGFPGAGALAVVWIIGAYSILFGILLMILAFSPTFSTHLKNR
ncbi:MAG: DUF308 domain-containing protein [Gammaproteobacteria bacterium]